MSQSATHCPFDYEKGEYESNEGYIWRLKRHAKSLEDACAASQTPPNPQAGAPSAYATMPPECCGNTMGFSRCEGCPDALPRKTAKEQFDGLIDERAFNDMASLERLRFFCSLAINGQDWLDIEPFFSALETPLSETAPLVAGDLATQREIHDTYAPVSATRESALVEACRGLISYWTRNLNNFQWEKADTHVKRINIALEGK